MTYELNVERNGLRIKAEIRTETLDTHSALQEVPREYVEAILNRIRVQLGSLLDQTLPHRKSS